MQTGHALLPVASPSLFRHFPLPILGIQMTDTDWLSDAQAMTTHQQP